MVRDSVGKIQRTTEKMEKKKKKHGRSCLTVRLEKSKSSKKTPQKNK